MNLGFSDNVIIVQGISIFFKSACFKFWNVVKAKFKFVKKINLKSTIFRLLVLYFLNVEKY